MCFLPTVQILPIIIRLAMVEPDSGEYNVMLFWLKPNENLAIPESEIMPQKQALILRGGVTTVSGLLDTSSFIHCLLTDSNNLYAIGDICMLASDAVIVAHRFKFDSDFIFIKTYNVRNTTAMIRMFQCRSCVISICKADWPHYDRVSSFSPLSTYISKYMIPR